ncbi:MAG: hypothetical protein ACREQI_09555 [Candidatus Binataceae bacterium]
MNKLLILAGVAVLSMAGCASTQTAQFDHDLSTIRSGYRECVSDLGPEAQPCKSLADGVHQVAEQVGGAASTTAAVKAEDATRHSMGY